MIPFPARKRILSSPELPNQLLGLFQLHNQWVRGALSPEVERPECETDHPLLTIAEIKNERRYTSSSLCTYVACKQTILPLLCFCYSQVDVTPYLYKDNYPYLNK
jgi:hypothetical protein